MMHAIIDIGSNSVRLCIFSDGNILLRDKITAQLGEGLYPDMLLTDFSMKRNVNAVATFYEKAISCGVKKANILPFATAAVRQAKNGQTFIDQVYEKTGLVIDLVPEEEEGVLGLIGALLDKNGFVQDGAILDVGGASSEIAVRKNGKIVYSHSIDIGAVKLTDMFGEDEKLLSDYVEKRVKEYGEIETDNVVVIGGSGTSLGFIHLKDEVYDSLRIDGHEISLDDLEQIKSRLFKLGFNERVEKLHLEDRRARVICAGATIICEIARYLNLDKITVSERDNLDGYYAVKTNKVKYE